MINETKNKLANNELTLGVGIVQSRVVEVYGSDWVALKVSGTGSEGRVAIAFSSF